MSNEDENRAGGGGDTPVSAGANDGTSGDTPRGFPDHRAGCSGPHALRRSFHRLRRGCGFARSRRARRELSSVVVRRCGRPVARAAVRPRSESAALHVEHERRRATSEESRGAGPRALVAAVRPTEREALLLRYVADLGIEDVARATSSDEDTVRQRISRALCQLCAVERGAPVRTSAPRWPRCAGASRIASRRCSTASPRTTSRISSPTTTTRATSCTTPSGWSRPCEVSPRIRPGSRRPRAGRHVSARCSDLPRDGCVVGCRGRCEGRRCGGRSRGGAGRQGSGPAGRERSDDTRPQPSDGFRGPARLRGPARRGESARVRNAERRDGDVLDAQEGLAGRSSLARRAARTERTARGAPRRCGCHRSTRVRRVALG